MARTSLVYFGSANDSTLGTARGLIAFVPLSIAFFAVSIVYNSGICTKIWTVLLMSLVLCSAIGVQLPRGRSEAVLYGGLVGLVVGISNLCLRSLAMGTGALTIIDLLIVVIMTLVMMGTALVTREVSVRLDLYGSEIQN